MIVHKHDTLVHPKMFNTTIACSNDAAIIDGWRGTQLFAARGRARSKRTMYTTAAAAASTDAVDALTTHARLMLKRRVRYNVVD